MLFTPQREAWTYPRNGLHAACWLVGELDYIPGFTSFLSLDKCYAFRYAAGYQSQDGNTENDATRALTPLCLPDITINIAHLFAGGNPPLWFVRSSDTARRSIASAHSTAASIYMHLYLMPVESRPQHIQQCSLSCYATHIIKFLVDAVIHANNAVLFSWRLFSPTMITVALAHRELMREIRKSGYWVPPDNYAWLGLLDTVLTGWEEHRREFPFVRRPLALQPKLSIANLIFIVSRTRGPCLGSCYLTACSSVEEMRSASAWKYTACIPQVRSRRGSRCRK